jgi:hypothetical protein
MVQEKSFKSHSFAFKDIQKKYDYCGVLTKNPLDLFSRSKKCNWKDKHAHKSY